MNPKPRSNTRRTAGYKEIKNQANICIRTPHLPINIQNNIKYEIRRSEPDIRTHKVRQENSITLFFFIFPIIMYLNIISPSFFLHNSC